MQSTSEVLMIRPVHFGYNAETAVNNYFQQKTDSTVQEIAVQEFDELVSKLRSNKIIVNVVEDTIEPHTPDSIFPNNWISFHEDKSVTLYPMFAVNRQKERKETAIQFIRDHFNITKINDLSFYEQSGVFLEGTGSMVLDRENKIVYACLSPRTNEDVLDHFCKLYKYSKVVFIAADSEGNLIYHTNVMLCIGSRFAVVCLEAIPEENERKHVIESLTASGKEIISISLQQLHHFAGNMLELINTNGDPILVLSTQAYQSLHQQQIDALEKYATILHSSLNTIETAGGGSARCMLAEIFNTPK
ncbi:MAG: arginine deiminase-related protein [Ferruginibacter sp.]